MRIEKGLKGSKIDKITQKTFKRAFLNQKPDVFVKSGQNTSDKSSILKNGAKVVAAAAASGLTALGFNKKSKLVECTPEEFEKIEYACVKEGISYGYEDIKTLNYLKENEPDFFDCLINNVEDIKYFSYMEPCENTSYANLYRAKVGDKELTIYTKDDGTILCRKFHSIDENGNKISSRKDILVDADTYRYTTKTENPDGTAHIVIESSAVADDLGIVHKIQEERFLNASGYTEKTIKRNIDGSVTNSFYEYDDDKSIVLPDKKQTENEWGRPTKIYTKKINSNGKVEYETTKNLKYSYYQESEFSMPKIKEDTVSENIDYKNNTKTFTQTENDMLVRQIRTITNPETGKVRKEILERSDVEGIFNSKIIDENGKEKIESKGVKNPDGSVFVEKHFESLDGTKTDYVFKSKPLQITKPVNILDNNGEILATSDINVNGKGKFDIIDKDGQSLAEIYPENSIDYVDANIEKFDNIEMSYKVTDKSGRALTTINRTFKRISPDTAISSLNGHEYSIKKLPDGLKIIDLKTKAEKNINYVDLLNSYYDLESAEKFFDTFSADMLLNFAEKGIKFNPAENKLESVYILDLYLSAGEDMYIFSHEAGHSKDLVADKKINTEKDVLNSELKGKLSQTDNFKRVFEEEKSAFLNSLSDSQKEFMYYFIKDLDHVTQKLYSSRQEVMAEFNAIFSTGLPPKEIAERSYYLQKYFPKTASVASALLNADSNLARQ